MEQPHGRYSICDETRRAPNSTEPGPEGHGVQYWRENGESERFDDLQEAQGFAKALWESTGRHHQIVVRDSADNEEIVQVFEAEPHDTTPETSADDTRRMPTAAKNG